MGTERCLARLKSRTPMEASPSIFLPPCFCPPFRGRGKLPYRLPRRSTRENMLVESLEFSQCGFLPLNLVSTHLFSVPPLRRHEEWCAHRRARRRRLGRQYLREDWTWLDIRQYAHTPRSPRPRRVHGRPSIRCTPHNHRRQRTAAAGRFPRRVTEDASEVVHHEGHEEHEEPGRSGKHVVRQWFSDRQKDRSRPIMGDRRPPSKLGEVQPDH